MGDQTLKCVRRFPVGFREVSILIRLEYTLKWIHWRYQRTSKDKRQGEITADRITAEKIRKDFMEKVASEINLGGISRVLRGKGGPKGTP